jgi:hypothetical protein
MSPIVYGRASWRARLINWASLLSYKFHKTLDCDTSCMTNTVRNLRDEKIEVFWRSSFMISLFIKDC